MRGLAIVCLAVVTGAGCDTPASPPESTAAGVGLDLPAGWKAAYRTILPDNLLRDVSRLASDEFEGRLPGSNGDRLARRYLIDRLAEMGYEPFFDRGRWEQPLDIVGLSSAMPEQWIFHGPEGNSVSYAFADEYMGASGVQQPEVSITDAEVVFVGYGIQAPEEGWDDFKGVDLRGKVLLMLNDDPDWDPEIFAGERKLYYGRWTYKYESAARQGAAAAIIIHTTPSAGYPWQVVRSSWMGEQFELPAGEEPRNQLNGWLTEDASRRLVVLSGHDLDALVESARSRDFRPVPLNITTSIEFSNEVRSTETANVAGILRGSDPALAEQAVVLSAHHDHFGIGEPDASGDVIYNGALDNGVAMSQALAVAGAFTRLPQRPRRSIIVLFPAAEEQGILGSRYFVHSGAIHPGLIAANINFELGNVWGRTRDVMVYGLGKSGLDEWLAVAARSQDRVITPEQDLRAGWFYRSDQISFARVGVPAIWFKSGVDFVGREPGWGEARYAEWIANDYHQPSDEVRDSWVLDGLAEDAQLGFMLAAAVATADNPPTWNPGDEFEDERQQALEDLGTRAGGPAIDEAGPASPLP
ncbi:MAG: M28 family peptidase [Acidobacteriota bacterium]|jgi:Zn-dependent M28 family amino/carboxypeptidase